MICICAAGVASVGDITEIMNIVSDDDEIIGEASREEIYAEGIKNFRVVNAFVVNDEGLIWVPRRHKDKILYPLHLDTSVGGHVKAGEAYEQALFRETEEEINIDLTVIPYKEVAYISPISTPVSAFMKVYFIYAEEVENYNEDDINEAFWMGPKDLIDALESGEDKAKSDLIVILKKVFCGA